MHLGERMMRALGFGLVSLVCASTAWAHPNDFSLLGLGRPDSTALSDPAVRRYRALSAELAMAVGPKALQPAETLGMSGFEVGLSSTLTPISSDKDYWRGQPGTPVFEGPLRGRDVPNALWVPTLTIRKGLPLSTDVGVSFGYLSASSVMMLGGEVKVALYESYLRYVPALSMRGAFGRLVGATDLDLITAEGDILTSLAFGVGGMAQVTPFLGAGVLFAHVNSQVIDETPYSVLQVQDDQRGGREGSLYTFPTLDWNKNKFTRYFGGVRVNVAMLTFSYSLDVGMIPYKFAKTTLLSHSFKLGFDV
jgi:hypothetical protein